MGFYSKFSEQDLIESYNNQIDYQGKVTPELLGEIISRGPIEDFQAKIENQKTILAERNRIIREIHQHYLNKSSKQECFSLINSELLTKKEIQILVDAKYAHIHQSIENLTVDSDTILNSIAGIIISSVISSFTITLLIYTINSLIVFHFFLLIPAYIINYFIIRLITKKTRDNLAVFIATFLATVLNFIFFIILIN
jgi:hypothetical protein